MVASSSPIRVRIKSRPWDPAPAPTPDPDPDPGTRNGDSLPNAGTSSTGSAVNDFWKTVVPGSTEDEGGRSVLEAGILISSRRSSWPSGRVVHNACCYPSNRTYVNIRSSIAKFRRGKRAEAETYLVTHRSEQGFHLLRRLSRKIDVYSLMRDFWRSADFWRY